MPALSDLPEIVGFFSYSRSDDKDSEGSLTSLRRRIQNELRGLLGRSEKTLRLWQDAEAIPSGTLWESEIGGAIKQAVFFIPIITPRVVVSEHCQEEFRRFLDREQALGRSDLVFPIIYIEISELEEGRWRDHPVLKDVGARQYVDWCDFRFEPESPAMRRAIAAFCRTIVTALKRSVVDPAEEADAARKRLAEQKAEDAKAAQALAEAEAARDREAIEARARVERDAARKRAEEDASLKRQAEREAEEERTARDSAAADRSRVEVEANARRQEDERRGSAESEARGSASDGSKGENTTEPLVAGTEHTRWSAFIFGTFIRSAPWFLAARGTLALVATLSTASTSQPFRLLTFISIHLSSILIGVFYITKNEDKNIFLMSFSMLLVVLVGMFDLFQILLLFENSDLSSRFMVIFGAIVYTQSSIYFVNKIRKQKGRQTYQM